MATDPTKHFKAAALVAALLNTVASLLMLFVLREGLVPSIGIAARVEYMNAHALAWRLSWCAWIAAAVSLIYLFIQWGLWLDDRSQKRCRHAIVPGVLIACLGLSADTIAEVFYIGYVPQLARAHRLVELQAIEPLIAMLTGFLGNGLYCLGGLLLSVAAIRHLERSRRWFIASLPIWLFGFALSFSAITESALGLQLTTALTMASFVLWCLCIWRFLPDEPQRAS